MSFSGLCLCQAPDFDNLGVERKEQALRWRHEVSDRECQHRHRPDGRGREVLEQRPPPIPSSNKQLLRGDRPSSQVPLTRARGLSFQTGPFHGPTLLP